MDVLDIFSWLPEKELSLEKIKEFVLKLYREEAVYDEFSLKMELPSDANDNIITVSNELIDEGKNICYLIRNDVIIAVIGYR